MKNPTMPTTWANQLKPRLFFSGVLLLAVLLGLGACAMVVGMSNRVKESEISNKVVKIPDLSPGEQEAMVVLVHRYTVRCCGAGSRVSLEGRHESSESWAEVLGPLEDFICWRVAPGDLHIAARDLHTETANAKFKASVAPGETLYLAVDADMREPPPYELAIQTLSENMGLHHVQQTLKRVGEFNTRGPSEDVIKRIQAKSAQRVQEKLMCIGE